MSSFYSSWPHRWVEDVHRSPIFAFGVGQQQQHQQYYGFYLQSVPLWLELLPIIAVEACIAALVSVPLYYSVAGTRTTSPHYRSQRQQPQEQELQHQKANGNHTNTTTGSNNKISSYVLAYGVLIPFWLLVPKPVLNGLGIDMKVARFCVAVISPILFIFRAAAAVHGCAPSYATRSLPNFALYMGSPMILLYDKDKRRYVKTTRRQVLRVFVRYLVWCFVTGMWQSCFFVFPDHFPRIYGGGGTQEENPIVVDKMEWYRPRELLSPRRWTEGAQFALLMQLYLTAYGEGLVLATCLITGIQSQPLMDNPMLASTSPSDFWGRRWNLLIHDCLKNGVYKPVVQQPWGSKALAAAAAFAASGLFHEWLLPIVFTGYPITHGTTLIFFLWQAILVSIETAIGHWTVFQYLSRILPTPVKTLCVVLLGLPFAHWFSEPWINSDFFIHGRMTLPCILPIAISSTNESGD